MDSTLLLPVVYLFAFANYYLGTFLLAAPIPHRGLKRFARYMIQDGVTYAILAPIALSLPSIIHATELYFSYDSQAAFVNLFHWLGFNESGQPITHGIIEEITGVYTSVIFKIMLASILIVFGKAASTLQLSYADALTTVLSGAIMSLQVLFYFALFIWKLALPLLASMGAIIYGLPARFGRQAGAALIAMGIVFYVGMPFMPHFVNMFAVPDRPRSAEIAALVDEFAIKADRFNKKYGELGTVRWQINPMGGPNDYYCILISDDMVWWTDERGGGECPLPAGEHAYTITHFGDTGYLTGHVTVTTNQTTEVSLTYPAWNFPVGTNSTGDVHATDVTIVSAGYGTIRVKCPEGSGISYVDVTVNNKTTLTNFRIEGDSLQVPATMQERSILYKVPIDLGRYGNGTRTIDFQVEGTGPTGRFPNNNLPTGENMMKEGKGVFSDQAKIFQPMFDFSSAVLLTTIVLPVTYLLILMQVGREVAKALGGRRMPLPEVT